MKHKKTIGLFFIVISCFCLFLGSCLAVQDSLSHKLLRLHILANSNSQFDQSLKLAVRDRIVDYLTPLLEESSSLEQTKNIISENLDKIQEIAQATTSQYANYPVSAYIGKSDFPTKHYDNFSLPAGKYEALKIIIGEGKGNNWWCVMFPPLCFTSSSAGTFDDKSKKKLHDTLTEEEYEMINSPENPKVKVKFRFLEWWNS